MPGRALRQTVLLQQTNRGSFFGELHRGGATSDAAADNYNIDFLGELASGEKSGVVVRVFSEDEFLVEFEHVLGVCGCFLCVCFVVF